MRAHCPATEEGPLGQHSLVLILNVKLNSSYPTGFTSFSLIFLTLNKFYFLSSLIAPTAAFHLPQLFVCGFRDCCRCRQSNLVGCRSFLFNGPSRSHDRVTERLNWKGQALHSEDEKESEIQELTRSPRVSEQRELVHLISS